MGSSTTDEVLQTVSSGESCPHSRLNQRPQVLTRKHPNTSNASTGSAQNPVDGSGPHQVWHQPPPAYEEEYLSQARPPRLPVPSLNPNTHKPDEWRKHPESLTTYPLLPVQDSISPPGFRIIEPVPKRPSDATDTGDTPNSGHSDSNGVGNDVTRPSFHRSFPSSRKSMNPNAVTRSSDEPTTQGVQVEKNANCDKRKWKWAGLEDNKKEDGGGEEDSGDIDEKVEGVYTTSADDDTDGGVHAGDTTSTTPGIRITNMAMDIIDNDTEMEDAPLRSGRTVYNPILREAGPIAKSDPRENTLMLEVDTASLPQSGTPEPHL